MRAVVEEPAKPLAHPYRSHRLTTVARCNTDEIDRKEETESIGKTGRKFYEYKPCGRSFDYIARKVPRAISLRMTRL